MIGITIKVQEGVLDLTKELEFSGEELNQAYIEQPAKFAYWASMASKSRFELDKAKLAVDRQETYLKKTLYGELDNEIRQKMEMDGEKITEAKVTSRIFSDKRYLEEQNKLYDLQEKVSELQYQTDTLYVAKDAFIQRKDMIISLGANIRQEKTNIEP